MYQHLPFHLGVEGEGLGGQAERGSACLLLAFSVGFDLEPVVVLLLADLYVLDQCDILLFHAIEPIIVSVSTASILSIRSLVCHACAYLGPATTLKSGIFSTVFFVLESMVAVEVF